MSTEAVTISAPGLAERVAARMAEDTILKNLRDSLAKAEQKRADNILKLKAENAKHYAEWRKHMSERRAAHYKAGKAYTKMERGRVAMMTTPPFIKKIKSRIRYREREVRRLTTTRIAWEAQRELAKRLKC